MITLGVYFQSTDKGYGLLTVHWTNGYWYWSNNTRVDGPAFTRYYGQHKVIPSG